jgi:hypothetical protein
MLPSDRAPAGQVHKSRPDTVDLEIHQKAHCIGGGWSFESPYQPLEAD